MCEHKQNRWCLTYRSSTHPPPHDKLIYGSNGGDPPVMMRWREEYSQFEEVGWEWTSMRVRTFDPPAYWSPVD